MFMKVVIQNISYVYNLVHWENYIKYNICIYYNVIKQLILYWLYLAEYGRTGPRPLDHFTEINLNFKQCSHFGPTYGWMDRQNDRSIDRSMNGRMDGWTNVPTDRPTNGRTDRQTDRLTERQVDSLRSRHFQHLQSGSDIRYA